MCPGNWYDIPKSDMFNVSKLVSSLDSPKLRYFSSASSSYYRL